MFTDAKSQALAVQQRFYGNPQGLAQYLIRICLNQIEVVYEVFMLLDDYSTLDVGCRFVSGCDFYQLVKTNNGLFLCSKLYEWLTQIRTFLQPTECAGNAAALLLLKSAIDSAQPELEKAKNKTAAIAYDDGKSVRIVVSNQNGSSDGQTYQTNKSGMIDVRDLSRHPAAKFTVADRQNVPEEYLSPKAATSLFNIAQKYSETYASDNKLVFTAGSASNGSPGNCGGQPCHTSHRQGSCVDIRYMNSSGQDITGFTAYKDADVERTVWLIKTFGKDGLTKVYTGDDTRFGLFDDSPKTMDKIEKVHRHHLHVGY